MFAFRKFIYIINFTQNLNSKSNYKNSYLPKIAYSSIPYSFCCIYITFYLVLFSPKFTSLIRKETDKSTSLACTLYLKNSLCSFLTKVRTHKMLSLTVGYASFCTQT